MAQIHPSPSPRTERLARLVFSSMADHFEQMYPTESSPTVLLEKLITHRPRGSENWDSEDATLFMGDMHTWLATASFDSRVHPRLCAVGAMAGMYVFVTSLEATQGGGCYMRGSLVPRQTLEDQAKMNGHVH